jgi:hypothetical protein
LNCTAAWHQKSIARGIGGHQAEVGEGVPDLPASAGCLLLTHSRRRPAGYLTLNEAIDIHPAQNAAFDYYNQTGTIPYHVRRADQITRFFDGLELLEPGSRANP